ncbi:MAG: hypothetical protein ABIT37_14285 [Luteolibacter sp.]
MSYDTFLIICGALIAIPFMITCFRGNPQIGLTAGVVSLLLMSFAAHNGASMLGVHLIGFVIAGFAIAWSRDD